MTIAGVTRAVSVAQLRLQLAGLLARGSSDPDVLAAIADIRALLYDETSQVSVMEYGAVGDGVADDTAAFVAAIAVAKRVTVPTGTYKITSTLTLPDGCAIVGASQSITGAIIKAGVAGLTLFKLSVGRNTLENLQLEGFSAVPASYTGTAIQIGDTDFSGSNILRNVRTYLWAKGLRLAGALWTTCYDCSFTYGTVGIDFNAGTGALYSTTCAFHTCIFANNQRQGVVGSNIPIRNTAISFFACTIEQNGLEAPATYPQYALGDVQNVIIDNCYLEYSTAGAKPIALDITNHAEGRIHAYINGSSTAIKATAGSVTDVLVHNSRSIGSTVASINVVTATRFRVLDGTWDSTVTISGTGSQQITAALAEIPQNMIAFTPTLEGTGGTAVHTYVWQAGWYSRIGNVVFFTINNRLSAKDAGMTGNVVVKGLPIASANQVVNYGHFDAQSQTITIAANHSKLYAELVSNVSQMEIYQQNTAGAAATALPATAIAATSFLFITGHYFV